MNVSYSVQINLRTDKKKADGTCPITYFVRLGSIVTKVSSKYSINPSDWDAKRHQPKLAVKDGKLLSKVLNDKVEGFKTFMLERVAFDKPITPSIAKAYFDAVTTIELYDFWDQQVDLMKKDCSPNTIKSYNSVLKILRAYNKKLCFGDINRAFIDRFDTYLRVKRQNTANGSCVKHRKLKHILNLAMQNGYIKENPYHGWPIKSSPGRREYLTIKEVTALKNLDFTEETAHLIRYRDLFLFSCWTGLRYSDVVGLKYSNIKLGEKPKLILTIRKTQRELVVALTENAIEIVLKYGFKPEKRGDLLVFPTIANPTINRYLKDLMKETGIEKSISFHCARHSFASNHIENRTPLTIIRDSLGHTNLTQTSIYAKSPESDVYECASRLNEMYN